ncbi:hypothetical protein E1281_25300 [Actinomadura sp. KC345]|uniref:hypothetical protein n=1 Tax=Actinomadura sp. KC345 TaxID=2530371 RepID=UPI001044C0F2|nr:hypothetical protein [Actinomadura sp. KC345]TDC48063.1 hypothetical protein E1281_25300 [Actinomadura sp. KC345]
MLAPPTSGFIRFTTERDPQGSAPARLTPILLGGEHPVGFAPDWVYAHLDDVSPYGGLALAKPGNKVYRKVNDLFQILGIGVEDGVLVREDVLANVGTDRHGAEMLRAAFAGVVFDGRREDWSMVGEPRQALSSLSTDEAKTITFFTGGCLGGADVTIARTPSGTYPLVQSATSSGLKEELYSVSFEPGETLSFYERETMYRLAVNIVKLVRRLPGRKVRIRLDVPRGQYYLYTLDAHQNGLIKPGACIEWFDAVDKRNRMVVEHFRQVFHTLGVHADVLSTTDELSSVAEYLREEYRANHTPTLNDLVNVMRDSGDSLWEHALDPRVRERTKVGPLDSVKAFNATAYSLAVAREAEAGPTIEIDDPVERPIFEGADRLSKPLPWKLQACGVYPQSRFHPRTIGVKDRRFHLYRDDPGHEVVLNDPDGLTGRTDGEVIVLDDLLPELYPVL